MACTPRRAVWLLPLFVLSAGALSSAVGQAPTDLRFDFETGDLQGWTIVEGRFDKLVCDRETFHNQPAVKYNKQGKYYLTTLERANGQAHDAMTGVIESPVFELTGASVSFLVGGGAHRNTYVALCTLDGKEHLRAHGKNTEVMQPVTWDAAKLVGRKVLVRIADHHRGSWGHITFDDLRAAGRVDDEATRARAVTRQLAPLRVAAAPLRQAIRDLAESFSDSYPDGKAFLDRLVDIRRRTESPTGQDLRKLKAEFEALRREALLANPLLRRHPILFVVRHQYKPDHHATATMFQNGEINTNSFQGGGAIKTIDFAHGGKVTTLLAVPDGVARDPELSFDGRKILFAMRKNKADDYHVFEIGVDGTGLRQLTFGSQLADIDPIYVPDGSIVFSSTREPKVCQCNRHVMANLFRMDADGGNVHQIGRNALFEGHSFLMPDGTILYDRWEYVDKHFGPAFGLWTVNPDGTNHAVYYGNHAWAPGAIVDARIIPGTHNFVATFGSCHDRPWGAIAVVDRTRGLDGLAPLVKTWPDDIRSYLANSRDYRGGKGRGHPVGGQIDSFKRLKQKYEDPYPLSDKYFLCSRTIAGERTGLFLLDIFGNEIMLHTEGPGCYDPMPVAPRPRPAVIPPRVDLAKDEGLAYVLDVYTGAGMERVPRGTVKWLRVVEAPPKLFWTRTYWNIDATQAPAMNWNSTNNKRILGKVPVEPDGSAYFAVPADKFVFFQLLDEDEMMIHSMRSGTMVRPGETIGCVGCHESRRTTAPNRPTGLAMRRPASRIEPWYGPPRDFNYLAEVQPVFDKHCVSCHDYGKPDGKAINLAGDLGLVFNTSYLELRRRSALRWFPDPSDAKKILVKAVDDGPPEVLPPYAWGSHRSRLVDAIRDEHYDVKLDKESFDRIVTWIDINAPYYGSYASAYPGNPFGRSPLSAAELKRLTELTDVRVGEQATHMQGAPINLTRPELSRALAGFENPDDPKRGEALAIIRTGKARLVEQPRMDMPGARLVGIERDRQRKHDLRREAEADARRALDATRTP